MQRSRGDREDGNGGGEDDGNNQEKRLKSVQQQQQQPPEQQKCPRCESTNTKFCYYNNYSLLQPRYFCKACRRYWTQGGMVRNVPIGGGSRKSNKRSNAKTPPPPSALTSSFNSIASGDGGGNLVFRPQQPLPSPPLPRPIIGMSLYGGGEGGFLDSMATIHSVAQNQPPRLQPQSDHSVRVPSFGGGDLHGLNAINSLNQLQRQMQFSNTNGGDNQEQQANIWLFPGFMGNNSDANASIYASHLLGSSLWSTTINSSSSTTTTTAAAATTTTAAGGSSTSKPSSQWQDCLPGTHNAPPP